jgi:hypothetical protein
MTAFGVEDVGALESGQTDYFMSGFAEHRDELLPDDPGRSGEDDSHV